MSRGLSERWKAHFASDIAWGASVEVDCCWEMASSLSVDVSINLARLRW